jgi:hypothetical protein
MDSFVMNVETLPNPIRKIVRAPRVSVQERNGNVILVPIWDTNRSAVITQNEHDARQALKSRIKAMRGIVRSDIDEKAELAQARSEKYENIG